MFGSKKTITDRVKESLTEYLDAKFEDYRGQIALDLSRGLASLAGLVAIWSLAIICMMFASITFALLLGWGFSFFMNSFAYILSFLLVAVGLLSFAYYILLHKEKYIEEPVFKIMAEALRKPEIWGIKDKQAKKEETTNQTTAQKTTASSNVIPPNIETTTTIDLPPTSLHEDID